MMPRLTVKFDDPEHGWIGLLIFENEQEKVHCDASDIAPSFDLLVMALLSLWEGKSEASVTWAEEPSEIDLIFTCHDESIHLEVVRFPGSFRPCSRATLMIDPIFTFVGSYDEVCLPFWRALRNLEGSYSPEELTNRWQGYFPHRELAFLTHQLAKD